MKWVANILGIAVLSAVTAGCSSYDRSLTRQTPVVTSLVTTGYCKCKSCCGWKRNWYGRPVFAYGKLKGKPKKVGVTATGTRASKGTIAADRRVYPFGTVMYIEGYGYGTVEDVGGAIKGQHVDLYFHSHQQAREWGKQTKQVRVWVPRR
jgi:3D (Asp-Asp-Asp) domain-containing protein